MVEHARSWPKNTFRCCLELARHKSIYVTDGCILKLQLIIFDDCFLQYFQDQIRGIMFDIVTNNYFEMTIMSIIALNMGTMMSQHYGQSERFDHTLNILCWE